jgi:hypothetical protein
MTTVRIWKEHHVRRGARSGVVEIREAYLYSNGKYKVADPSLGRKHNLKNNLIECDDLDQVWGYVGKKFEVVMRSGVGKPSFNSSDGMQREVR